MKLLFWFHFDFSLKVIFVLRSALLHHSAYTILGFKLFFLQVSNGSNFAAAYDKHDSSDCCWDNQDAWR